MWHVNIVHNWALAPLFLNPIFSVMAVDAYTAMLLVSELPPKSYLENY